MQILADFSIDIASAEIESKVRELVLKVIPQWSGVEASEVEVKELTGGITNKLMKCKANGENILVRVYGQNTELFIDREKEIKQMDTLASLGKGAKVYAKIANGFVYAFTPGTVLDPPRIAAPEYRLKIAAAVAQLHQIQLPAESSSAPSAPSLFVTLFRFLELAKECNFDSNPEKAAKLAALDLPKLERELRELQAILEAQGAGIVFCHNDLLAYNILHDEEQDKIQFIDMEYANYSYGSYDIANHFCEWAGFELEWFRFPTRDQQVEWLHTYLLATSPSSTVADAEALQAQVSRFTLASHFFWGLWGIVQAKFSEIEFDYLDYARQRFSRYYETKSECLGSL